MFLRFFRSSFATQYIAVGLIGLLLWMPSLIHPASMPSSSLEAPLYSVIFCLISGMPHLQVLIGFIIMLFSAFTCNYIFSHNDIVTKNSSLAALSFVIFSSWFPEALTLNPVSFSLIFILIAIRALYASYSRSESLDLAYTAGFFTGVAALIYPPSSLLMLFLWVTLIIFRSADWRSFISTVIGLMTPFLFISVYYFWFDKFELKARLYIQNFQAFRIPSFSGDLLYLILLLIILFVFLCVMVNCYGHLSENTIEGRRKNLILYWYSFFAILLFAFPDQQFKYSALMIAIPMAGLLSSYLLRIRKNLWQEILWIVFIMFVLANNYYQLFSGY